MGMSMRAVTHPTDNPVNDPNHIEPCCGNAVPGAIRGSRHGHSRGLMMNTHRATPFLFLHFPFPYIFCNLENSRIPFPVANVSWCSIFPIISNCRNNHSLCHLRYNVRIEPRGLKLSAKRRRTSPRRLGRMVRGRHDKHLFYAPPSLLQQ